MKAKFALLILGAGVLVMASCTKYPPAADRLTEDLAIVTQYDTGTNFNNYKTFSIPSTILMITDKDTTQVTNATATAVLDETAKNLTARGFVQVSPPVKPDLAVEVLYFQNTHVYVYYYDYWGYYPYWYYYYPYYPVYYSTYTTGVADIELIDYKYPNNNTQTLAIRWNAFIRALLTGNHTTSEITGAVDQAFIQTPQIVTTAK
jgi:hypothetical protein